MTRDKRKIVVLGVGNLLLGDEGVGVHAVNALKKESLPRSVEVIDGGTAGLDLMFMLEGAAFAVIIDCLEAGAEPGTIFRVPVEELMASAPGRNISLHETSLPEMLSLAAKMGKLPPAAVVYGVQPEKINFSTELSGPVQKELPRLVKLIKEEVKHYL